MLSDVEGALLLLVVLLLTPLVLPLVLISVLTDSLPKNSRHNLDE